MVDYSVIEAKNNLSKLIKKSVAGDRVVITNRGVPSVELVPVDKSQNILTAHELAKWLGANPLPERLSKTSAEIEQIITQNRDAWE